MQYYFTTGMVELGKFKARSVEAAWDIVNERLANYKPEGNPVGNLYQIVDVPCPYISKDGIKLVTVQEKKLVLQGSVHVALAKVERE